MKQIRNFADDRLKHFCAFCGQAPATRDHVPSRVLLDEPYPEELPVIQSCLACNRSFSMDEEYLACLIESVLAGSCEDDALERPKVRRILRERPLLAERLRKARYIEAGITHFAVEHERVQKIILKLARGHAAFENAEPCLEEPDTIWSAPLQTLSTRVREQFEALPSTGLSLWPEVGSRAMVRLLNGEARHGWIMVQPGRYRYAVTVTGGVLVRIVLSEYLAAVVNWQ